MKIEHKKKSGLVLGLFFLFLTAGLAVGQSAGDSDGDGVADATDLDDDNDGITDAVESRCSTANDNTLAWSGDAEPKRNITHTVPEFVTNTVGSTPFSDGSGVTTSINLTSFELAGVSSTTDPQVAIANGDYLLYSFTTASTIGSTSKISGFRTSSPTGTSYSGYYPYSIDFQLSKDGTNFSTLGSGTVTENGGNFQVNNVSANPVTLIPNTNYTVRIVFYNYNKTGNTVRFDNVGISFCKELDTDNDGVPNRLDLDSDGDGCYDKYEAGVTGYTQNGTYTDSLTIVHNTAGDAGTNGLSNSVETAADNGTVNYTSTYDQYALNNSIKRCTDADRDGIADVDDIDDDNDGITDAVESGCSTANDNTLAWSGDAEPKRNITHTVPEFVTNTVGSTPFSDGSGVTTSINLTSFQLAGVSSTTDPQVAIANGDYLLYSFTTASTIGSTSKISGFRTSSPTGTSYSGYYPYSIDFQLSKDGTNFSTLGSGTVTENGGNFQVNNVSANPVTLIPNTKYTVRIVFYNYNKTGNTVRFDNVGISFCKELDTDNDGVPNRLDLDSDGDGCYDKYEAGVTGYTQNGTYTDSLTIVHNTAGDAGANGLSNSVETAADNGTVNYTSTYDQYALKGSIKLCTDPDRDGISNIDDLDDDNDGITDAVETGCSTADNTLRWSGDTTPKRNISRTVPEFVTNAVGSTPFSDGSGVTTTFNATSFQLAGVSSTTDPQVAIANGDYLLYSFTTASTIGSTSKISAFTTSSPSITDGSSYPGYYPYRLDFQLSKNGSNFSTLASGTVTDNGGTFTANSVSANPMTLIPNTKYTVRIVFYNYNKTGNTVRFDNVGISFCKELDTDNDGVPNRLDLDSDGDGCTDAEEAGTYNKAGVVMQSGEVKNGSGGFVSSVESNPNAVVGGPYGGNGFADVLQKASPDTNQYKYTYTYSQATDSTVHACCPVISDNTIGSDQGVCPAGTPNTLTGSVPTLRPTGATVLYQWMSSTSSATSGFSNMAGRTSKDFTFSGPLAQTTHYRRVAHTAGCSKYNDTTAAVTVTVKPLPTITNVVAPTCLDKQKYLTAFETSGQANSTVTVLPEGLKVNRSPRDTTTTGGDESWHLEVPSGTNFTVTVTENGCSVEKGYTAPPDSCGGNSPYALGLEGFSAERVEGGIRLSWRVAEPGQLDRVVLERGGVPAGLESIGVFLDPLGDGYFSHVDRTPIAGDNFYRLSLFGLDGTVEISQKFRVAYGPLDKYAYLLHNPVEGGMAVLRTNADAPVVGVYDLSGRAVPFSSDRQIGGDLHLFFGGMSDRVLIVRLRAGHLVRSFRVVLR